MWSLVLAFACVNDAALSAVKRHLFTEQAVV
jgi:hypothetical protein